MNKRSIRTEIKRISNRKHILLNYASTIQDMMQSKYATIPIIQLILVMIKKKLIEERYRQGVYLQKLILENSRKNMLCENNVFVLYLKKSIQQIFSPQWAKMQYCFGDIIESFYEEIEYNPTKKHKLGVYINTTWEIVTFFLYVFRISISDFVNSKFFRINGKEKPKSKIK